MCIWFALCTVWGHRCLSGTLTALLKARPVLARHGSDSAWPLIPGRPLSHTVLRNAGSPGLELWERGGRRRGNLGVKEWLEGWRNRGAGRESVSVCVCMFTVCSCPLLLTVLHLSPEGTIHASVCTCRPGRLCLLCSLCPGSFLPPGNAKCQCRCFIGSGCCVCRLFLPLSLSLCLLPGHPHT